MSASGSAVRSRASETEPTHSSDAPEPELLSNAASYCYDGLGRLTQAAPTSRRASGPYSAIAYDANGSRTLKDKGAGNKDELVYDARGLLTQVKRWTNGSVTSSQTNVYDYAGSRVVKAPSSGAGTTIRTYSSYAEVGGGNLTKYFYFGGRMIGSYTVAAPAHLNAGDRDPDLVVPPSRIELPPQVLLPLASAILLLLFLPLGRRRRLGVRLSLARSASLSVVFLTATSPVVLLAGCGTDPVVRVYHVDHLGSAQVVTDWSGNVFRQIRYTAYGEIRGRFNAAGNPAGFSEDARFEFTGYETDFAGLDYAGARFLDPELAQFASHDPAGQYPSPYAYGPGDPVNGTDPTGEIFGGLLPFLYVKHETGSTRAAFRATLEAGANYFTAGIYGRVKALSNDDFWRYELDFLANTLTYGFYGTVRSFNDGDWASGVLGLGQLAYGIYTATSSPTVSGNEIAQIAGIQKTQGQVDAGGLLVTDPIAEGTALGSEGLLPKTSKIPVKGSGYPIEVGTVFRMDITDPAEPGWFDFFRPAKKFDVTLNMELKGNVPFVVELG